MKIREALKTRRLYIEAAPLIYYVEENPAYIERMDAIIELIDANSVEVISSVLTLTEVLNQPIRQERQDIERKYRAILLRSRSFTLLPIDAETAEVAARLRARYNMRTPDALHVASALQANCGGFLTNDKTLKRVTEIRIVLLDELELEDA